MNCGWHYGQDNISDIFLLMNSHAFWVQSDLVRCPCSMHSLAVTLFQHLLAGGKKTCWEVWNKYPDVTTVFNELSKLPPFISNTFLTAIECFTVRLYDFSSHSSSVNSTRRKLFSQKGRTIENIPPTQDALGLHLKRAVYQAGHVWSQALVPLPVLPNPADWGWALCDGLWQPLWMTLPDVAKCCPELKRCGCGTGCSTKRCRCFKDDLPCTALCACDAQCRQ